MVTASPLSAYSVLSHEATIDVTWDSAIVPLLKQLFPRASADDLLRAWSFAYGGSVTTHRIRSRSIPAGRVNFGDYSLADDTYGELLHRRSDRKFQGTPVALTRNILTFYGEGPGPSVADKKVKN